MNTTSVRSTRPPKNQYLNNKDLLAEIKICKEKGQMSDKCARMLQLLCANIAKKGNFINYCVDHTTQALTKGGWKSYDQITTSDTILSYDVNTGALAWSPILDIYINTQYDDYMHHLTTQGLDALVTPNHKFVSVERGIIAVEDIICNEHIVLMGTAVEHPQATHEDDLIELIGWAITEGHYSTKSKKRHSIRIAQKQGAKSDRIRQLLVSLNIPFKQYHQKNDIDIFHCTGSTICQIHQMLAPNRVPCIELIHQLTQQQRMLLIKTMISGDGWHRPSGGMSYIQRDQHHIDRFVMLCTLAGLTTSTALHTRTVPYSGNASDCYTVNIYSTPKLSCKAESIDFHGGRTTAGGIRSNKQNIPTVMYQGTIWCPQTMYGTFVCRRNGYVYVTGNTYNDDMQGYAMMMLVRTWKSFDPSKSSNAFAFFTQCIKNSFIQFLKSEKKHRLLRDKLLIDRGMNPSFGYQESNDGHIVEDEEDYHAQKQAADSLMNSLTEYDTLMQNQGDSDSAVDEDSVSEDNHEGDNYNKLE